MKDHGSKFIILELQPHLVPKLQGRNQGFAVDKFHHVDLVVLLVVVEGGGCRDDWSVPKIVRAFSSWLVVQRHLIVSPTLACLSSLKIILHEVSFSGYSLLWTDEKSSRWCTKPTNIIDDIEPCQDVEHSRHLGVDNMMSFFLGLFNNVFVIKNPSPCYTESLVKFSLERGLRYLPFFPSLKCRRLLYETGPGSASFQERVKYGSSHSIQSPGMSLSSLRCLVVDCIRKHGCQDPFASLLSRLALRR